MTSLLRNKRRLRAFVASLSCGFEGVDEIVQNASLVAWRKIETFSYRASSPDAEFFGWIFAIARFEAMSFHRRSRPGVVLFDDELLEDLVDMRLEEAGYLESRHQALLSCLERLPARDRDLVCNRYGHDLTVQDLAASTGRTVEAIYKALGRIRAALFSCIDRTLKQEDR